MNKTIKALVCLISIGFAGVGCSQSTNYLQSVDLSVSTPTNQPNGQSDQYISLSMTLNLGNSTIAAISLPVTDPKTQEKIGTLSVAANTNGSTTVTLAANTTSLLSGDSALGQTLPNGGSIPVALGTQVGQLLAIPVLNNSRIYFGGDLKTELFVGAALSIPALGTVTQSILPGASLLFSKSFGDTLGVAGLYTSTVTADNGIAVFARYTPPAAQASPTPSVVPVASTTASTPSSTQALTAAAKIATLNRPQILPTPTASAPSASAPTASAPSTSSPASAVVEAPVQTLSCKSPTSSEQMHNHRMSHQNASDFFSYLNSKQVLRVH